MKEKHHFALTKRDRERIEVWIKSLSQTEIAKRIGCHKSTLSREMKRGKDSIRVPIDLCMRTKKRCLESEQEN